jgi:chemosensory pili system protein ChpA (sensor histidine kinase/response regulator)
LTPRADTHGMMEARQILIVDDEEHIRVLLTLVAEKAGLEVRTAKDGAEALLLLWDGLVPDIIVTDVEMPIVDGIELATLIRSMDALRSTPVIAFTGREPDATGRRLTDAWIGKDRTDVLAALLRALRRARPPADHPG